MVLDGDELRRHIIAEIGASIGDDPELGEIGLAIVLTDSDPVSNEYAHSKREWARAAGISTRIIELSEPKHDDVRTAVEVLASDSSVHGLLVQLPLVEGVRTSEILDAIPLEKDVDGLSSRSCWRAMSGSPGHVPCTPLAITRFIDHYRIATDRQHAVVVGETLGDGAVPMALLAARGLSSHVRTGRQRRSRGSLPLG